MKSHIIILGIMLVLLFGCVQQNAPVKPSQEIPSKNSFDDNEGLEQELGDLDVQINGSEIEESQVVEPLPEQTNVSVDSVTPTPAPTPSTSNQAYSLAEVARHSTRSDCWLVIQNKVYDVTQFIPSHPGGSAILQGCGADATTYFTDIHNRQAWDLLPPYYIGDVK